MKIEVPCTWPLLESALEPNPHQRDTARLLPCKSTWVSNPGVYITPRSREVVAILRDCEANIVRICRDYIIWE